MVLPLFLENGAVRALSPNNPVGWGRIFVPSVCPRGWQMVGQGHKIDENATPADWIIGGTDSNGNIF